MPKATPGYLREISALTSGNREMYRNACKDAADEIERLQAAFRRIIYLEGYDTKVSFEYFAQGVATEALGWRKVEPGDQQCVPSGESNGEG
jgi:hypothetical protein